MAERITAATLPADKKELILQDSNVDQELPTSLEDKIQSLIVLGKEKGIITIDDFVGIMSDGDGDLDFQTEGIPDLIIEKLEEEGIPYFDEEQLEKFIEETVDEKD